MHPHRSLPIPLLLLISLALFSAPSAGAQATATKIIAAQCDADTFEYSASQISGPGQIYVVVKWKRADDSDSRGYPWDAVTCLVQGRNGGEPYVPMCETPTFGGLDGNGWRLSTAMVSVGDGSGSTIAADQALYVTVRPYVGEAKYELEVTFLPEGGSPVVLSSSPSPSTGTVLAASGDFLFDHPGDYHTVLQSWPGTGPNKVLADWDDHLAPRDGTYSMRVDNMALNWTCGWKDNGDGSFDKSVVVSNGVRPSRRFQAKWCATYPAIDVSAAVDASGNNTWPVGATYPKPGSLAFDAAPLLYTYAYPVEAVSTEADGWDGWTQLRNYPVTYNWSTEAESAASSSSVAASSEVYPVDFNDTTPGTGTPIPLGDRAAIVYRFWGTSFSWYYGLHPSGTHVLVYVDGDLQTTTTGGSTGSGPLAVDPETGNACVDLYGASATFGQFVTFGGFTEGDHVVRVVSDGHKNPASTTNNSHVLRHDAFLATTDPDDADPRSEDNLDGSTFYEWATGHDGCAQGGEYAYAYANSSVTAYSFYGDTVTWFYGVYAPNGNWWNSSPISGLYMYVATCHIDVNETSDWLFPLGGADGLPEEFPTPNLGSFSKYKYSGNSEWLEHYIADQWATLFGEETVTIDSVPLGNAENAFIGGIDSYNNLLTGKWWNSDGLATVLWYPY